MLHTPTFPPPSSQASPRHGDPALLEKKITRMVATEGRAQIQRISLCLDNHATGCYVPQNPSTEVQSPPQPGTAMYLDVFGDGIFKVIRENGVIRVSPNPVSGVLLKGDWAADT